MSQFTFVPSVEGPDIADDIRRLFDDLAATLKHEHRAYSGECRPSLDVLETDEAIEVVMDVAGVPLEAVRVVFRSGVLIVAGEKAPPPGDGTQAYHLVEREFGCFARAVRLSGAFDVTRSHATMRDGELTVVLPKLSDRRGHGHRIRVDTGPDASRVKSPGPSKVEGPA
jgi:HSP20 family protein